MTYNPFSEGAFQRHLYTISANRQGYNSGFRPGTQTLDGRKFDEDRRQFDLSLADTQQARKADALRQALEFKEKKRQFDLTHDLARQETEYAVNKPYVSLDSGSSSGNGGGSVNPFAGTGAGIPGKGDAILKMEFDALHEPEAAPTTTAYAPDRIQSYIDKHRERLGNDADKTYSYVLNHKELAPGFKAAVLRRLDEMTGVR